MLKPSPDVGSADVMELKLSMFDLILILFFSFLFSRRITGVFTFDLLVDNVPRTGPPHATGYKRRYFDRAPHHKDNTPQAR